MAILADVLVALVAAVTALPAMVAVRPALGRTLYGLEPASLTPELALMVAHRAALFAVISVLLAGSIALPSWRAPATLAAALAKVTFVVLARRHRALPAIARTDVVLLGMLAAAWALHPHAS